MTIENGIAVLVIGYRRKDNIKKILEICATNKVYRIYVALDGPKQDSGSGLIDNLEIQRVIDAFERIYAGEVKKFYHDSNLGCAASVLSACDWAFKTAENLIILEDDCIPTSDFFNFSKFINLTTVKMINIFLEEDWELMHIMICIK